MRMAAQLYEHLSRWELRISRCAILSEGQHDDPDSCGMNFYEAVRAILWQLMPCCATVRGSLFLIKLFCAVFLVRQHFSIAHAKSQEGLKGGNGFLHDLGVLPSVGSTNHGRPLRTQMGASMWGGGVRRIQ
jgi:hypothetical protein